MRRRSCRRGPTTPRGAGWRNCHRGPAGAPGAAWEARASYQPRRLPALSRRGRGDLPLSYLCVGRGEEIEPAQGLGFEHELDRVLRAGLAEEDRAEDLNGLGADLKPAGDLPGGAALRDQQEDLALAGRQSLVPW